MITKPGSGVRSAGVISFAGLSSRFTAMGIYNGLPVVVGGGRLIKGRLLFEEIRYVFHGFAVVC